MLEEDPSGGLAITVIAKVQGAFNSYLPVFEMLIGLTFAAAVLVLFLRKMRRNNPQQNQPAPISGT